MIRIINSTLKYNFVGRDYCFMRKSQIVFRNICAFSKNKKEKVEFVVPSIHVSKYNSEIQGFLLYENKQAKQFKYLSIAFLVYLAWAGYTYQTTNDEEVRINFLVMGSFMLFSFVIFQLRLRNTLKTLILDNQGENIVITRFRAGGFKEQKTKAKVQVLRGIGKAFVFGGNVIKGGGVYGLQNRKYWFQSKYIQQPIIFQQVAQGHRVKVDKTKII